MKTKNERRTIDWSRWFILHIVPLSTGVDVEAFTVLNRLSIRLDETMKGLCAMKENSFNNYNYNIAGMKCVFVIVNQVKKLQLHRYLLLYSKCAHTKPENYREGYRINESSTVLPVNFYIDYVLVLKFSTVLLLHLLYYSFKLHPVDPQRIRSTRPHLHQPIQKPTMSS